MIKKFIDRSVQYANKFLFTQDDDTTFTATIEAQPGTISQAGTALEAANFNAIQKNCVYSLTSTYEALTDYNYYTVDLTGIEDFGLFEGLKLQVYIPAVNSAGTGRSFLKIYDEDTLVDTVEVYKKDSDGLNTALESYELCIGKYAELQYTGGVFILTKLPSLPEQNEDNIEKLLRLGYTFGGNLSEQETVVSNYIYNAYDLEEDSADHVYYLCNTGKSWTLGDDNPDSDFEEATYRALLDKVETLSGAILYNPSNTTGLASLSVLYNKLGVTIDSGVVTLPAGKYYIEAVARTDKGSLVSAWSTYLYARKPDDTNLAVSNHAGHNQTTTITRQTHTVNWYHDTSTKGTDFKLVVDSTTWTGGEEYGQVKITKLA